MSRKQEITAIAYDKRGKILSIGKNSYVKTHPLQAKFARDTGRAGKIYLHAEVDALIRARRNKVHKLVVIRYDRWGKPALAKPCPSCQKAIEYFHVKEVEHT